MKNFYKDTTGAIAFEDSAPVGYTLITDVEEKQQAWKNKYEERRIDGENYYTETQAELYIDILDGVYTSTEVFEFESHTSDLSKQIRTGNWLTAQSVIDDLPLSGIFDATKKSEIKTYIDDYVNDNY
jgi:hypothetical protein